MGQIKVTPLFVRHKFVLTDVSSYLSLLIRWVLQFKYNHCAIRYTEDGIDYVVDARSGGIVKSTFIHWLEHRPRKAWIEGKQVSVEQVDINRRLGIAYNTPSLFTQLVYQYTNIWLGDKSDTQENCAEFLADITHIEKAYLATPKSLFFKFR